MTIDISQMDGEQALAVLGMGTWEIALPDGYPELVVEPEWREGIIAWTCCAYVRWVKDGKSRAITFDYDPPWDHSGEVLSRDTDPLILRGRYATLGAWLADEYTGQWRATFESGYGKYWDTFGNYLEEYLQERITALLKDQCPDQFAEADMSIDPWDDLCMVSTLLEWMLKLSVEPVSTADAWERFEILTLRQMETERRRQTEAAARRERQGEQARHFWMTHFTDLTTERIDRPRYRNLRLEERLRDLLADTDPAVVEAIAEFGLPGQFSNRVHEAIQALARAALRD